MHAATVYTLDEGLSQNTVGAICRDPQGFLWLGTEDGLNRFDGYGFRVFRHAHDDPRTLSASFVTAIAVAPGGLWVGTEGGGLNWFDRRTEQVRRFPVGLPGGLANGFVTALAGGRDGELWVGMRGGGLAVVRWEGGPGTAGMQIAPVPLPAAGTRAGANVWGLHAGKSGLWIATQAGAFLRPADGTAIVAVRDHSLPAEGQINFDEILELPDGTVLLGSWDHGLFRRLPGQQRWQSVPHPFEVTAGRSLRALGMTADGHGTAWIGTDRGLALLDPGAAAMQPMNPQEWSDDAATGVMVYSVSADPAGGVWAGSWGEGLAHLGANDRWFKRIGVLDGLNQKRVRAILPEPDGAVLVGSFGGGVQLFPVQGEPRTLPFADGVPHVARLVWTLIRRGDGSLLVGTDHGLYRQARAGEALAPWRPEGWPDPVEGIRATLQAKDGGLWVGTSSGLQHIDRSDHATTIELSPQTTLRAADHNIYALLEQADGTLYAGSWGGLFARLPDGRVQVYRHQPDGLPASIVWSLLPDPAGGLWIGTAAGLVHAEGPPDALRLSTIRVAGLGSGPVYAMQRDLAGQLWLATNAGLVRLAGSPFTAQVFHERDGLLSDEFHVGASAKDGAGRLYFGGLDGLVSFDPAQLEPSAPPPAPVLTGVTLGNQRLVIDLSTDAPPLLELAAGRGPLGVDFSAIDGDRGPSLRYRYRWSGLGQAWTELDQRRSLSLSALPVGDYALQVQALGIGGLSSAVGTLLQMHVAPPVWQQTWVLVAAGLGTVALLWLVGRWRSRAIRARSRWLQAQVDARTTELSSTARALATANAQLRELSIRDGLTGLYNRRHLLELAPDQPGRHSCVLIDLDHFKAINDRYGHAAGDRVLLAFAAQLRQATNGPDPAVCGRYGGEEFLVFLPDRDRFMAAHWADGIRRQLASTPIEAELAGDLVLTCTASFGVAERETGEPLDAWIARADGALYTAKHRGRDRVEIAG